MLYKNTSMDETVLTMDMVNPSAYALGRRPAVGGIITAAYRYTLSDMYRPSDERYFGTADMSWSRTSPLCPICLTTDFTGFTSGDCTIISLVAESDDWYLYRRE